MGKLEELAQLSAYDFQSTEQYVERVLLGITKIYRRLLTYFEADDSQIFFLGPDKARVTSPQGLAEADAQGFLNYRIVVKVNEQKFNAHCAGKDFLNKGLAPPSGVILLIGVAPRNSAFLVKAPAPKGAEWTTIDIGLELEDPDNPAWTELLESCYQSVRRIVEGGLAYRHQQLAIQGWGDEARDRVSIFR
ncbi:MAG TPA: hypothetical protein V6D07_01015 [Trichocoleus sp.]